jgi:hypothetical protein
MADRLRFRRVTGEQVEAMAVLDDAEFPAGDFLIARQVRLEDGTELRQHRVAAAAKRLGGDSPYGDSGYDRLDNEILAGRRLGRVATWRYPPELARLYGDEATSADPYALFEPYLGVPLREAAAYLLGDELEAFQVSLLTGLCWLAAAGVAHRAISPDTVLWDARGGMAQITDFSRSTVFGVPRTPVDGSWDWVAREQRPGTAYGTVGPQDDIWAAGRLIYFASSQGEDIVDRSQLVGHGLAELLGEVFGPPEGRPAASDLLALKGRGNPAPRLADGAALNQGRRLFLEARERKHPSALVPPELGEDLAMPARADVPGKTAASSDTSGPGGEMAGNAAPESDVARDGRPGTTGGRNAGDGDETVTRSRRFPWGRGA